MPSYGATANLVALNPTRPLITSGGQEGVKKLTLEKLTLKKSKLEDAKVEKSDDLQAAELVEATQRIVLEGVFHSSHNEQATTVVINGKALKVNDYIGIYRLESVNNTSVILRSPKQQLKLSLFSSVIK